MSAEDLPVKPTVLHVIESFGGGSARAMRQFATETPGIRHALLRSLRAGEHVEGELLPEFTDVREMPKDLVGRMRAVRRLVRELRPQVIHAHSSKAGALVRLAIRTRRESRIVYSPHCFAFERADISALARLAIYASEFVLSINTDQIAACSQREQGLAAAMLARRKPVYIPNVASTSLARKARTARGLRVVGVGRVSSQKDPGFFVETVTGLKARIPEASGEWVGNGDAGEVANLRLHGVEVSGWLSNEEVSRRLDSADAYLHAARWEGFPLAILEASAHGLPIVARRIRALDGAPAEWLADTPAEAAVALERVLAGDARENVEVWSSFLAGNNQSAQRAALADLYAVG